jgi:hypothetical protein
MSKDFESLEGIIANSEMKLDDVIARLKTLISGNVYQIDKMSFGFNREKRPEIIDWLHERQVDFNNSGKTYTQVVFENISLAMEFKLRFMGV